MQTKQRSHKWSVSSIIVQDVAKVCNGAYLPLVFRKSKQKFFISRIFLLHTGFIKFYEIFLNENYEKLFNSTCSFSYNRPETMFELLDRFSLPQFIFSHEKLFKVKEKFNP